MDVSEPADAVRTGVIQNFLVCTDLDELLALRQQLGDSPLSGADIDLIDVVLDRWIDQQAVANLLMHPRLIPPGRRNGDLLRGLDDVELPYLRLAACVGVGDLQLGDTTDVERGRLVSTLVDLISSEDDLCADRASFSLVWLMRQFDAPEVIPCLAHPSERVRHNVLQGLLELLGASGLRALLTEPGFVDPAEQLAGLGAANEAGIDFNAPTDDQIRPLVLAFVPNLVDYEPDRPV